MVAKFLAREDIAEVDFNFDAVKNLQRIAEGYGGVRQPPGIDDNGIGAVGGGGVDGLDEFGFGIGLHEAEVDIVFLGGVLADGFYISKAGRAVNFRFARA